MYSRLPSDEKGWPLNRIITFQCRGDLLKRLEQAALTSFVQQGMLEVQVMAEREKKKREKKTKKKDGLGETGALWVTGHILVTAYLTP